MSPQTFPRRLTMRSRRVGGELWPYPDEGEQQSIIVLKELDIDFW